MTWLLAWQLLQQRFCPRSGGHRPHKAGVTPPTQRQTMERVSGMMTSRCPRSETVSGWTPVSPQSAHLNRTADSQICVCVLGRRPCSPTAAKRGTLSLWSHPLLEKHMSHGWKKEEKNSFWVALLHISALSLGNTRVHGHLWSAWWRCLLSACVINRSAEERNPKNEDDDDASSTINSLASLKEQGSSSLTRLAGWRCISNISGRPSIHLTGTSCVLSRRQACKMK